MKIYPLTIFIILFISSRQLIASKKGPKIKEKSYFLTTSEVIPMELSIIVKSMQTSPQQAVTYLINKDHIKKFNANMLELNQLFSILNKEEMDFFVKGVIYKSIVKKYTYLLPQTSSFTAPVIKDLLHFKEANQKKIRLFTHWLIDTLISDFNQIKKSKDYKNFIVNFKQPKKSKDQKYQVIYKKLAVLLVWYEKITAQDIIALNKSMNQFMHAILSQIIIVTKNYLTFTKKIKLPALASFENLNLFPRKEWTTSTQLFHNQSLDEILAPILNQNPDKNFKLTDKLPEPINDWMPEDDQKIKQSIDAKMNRAILDHRIDPNYIVPKNLPKPINDW